MRNNGHGPMADTPRIEEVALDLTLLRGVARRKAGRLLGIGALVTVAVAVLLLAVAPQSYSASVSISLQQTAPALGGLGSLIGLGGGSTTRYVGVLRSTRLAREVERRTHLRELYNLPTERAAVDLVKRSIKIDNNAADGLLYVNVSLGGPPKLAPDPDGKKAKIEHAVAAIADSYSAALGKYMKYSDTDKDSVLLREADRKLRAARQSYDDSITRLITFVRGERGHAASGDAPVDSTSSSASRLPGSAAAVTQLQSLYMKRGQLALSMKSAETGQSAVDSLLGQPLSALSTIPAEDPLLGDARQQVSDAASALKNLQVQLGSDNPRVLTAQARLKIAQDRLQEQISAIKGGRTSEEVRYKRMQAEYGEVQRQIYGAEQDFKVSREMSAEYERLHNEVLIRLDALKTIFSRYAELSLQTVAAQNRMQVVDDAQVPLTGSPGLMMAALLALLAGLAASTLTLLIAYARERSASAHAVTALALEASSSAAVH